MGNKPLNNSCYSNSNRQNQNNISSINQWQHNSPSNEIIDNNLYDDDEPITIGNINKVSTDTKGENLTPPIVDLNDYVDLDIKLKQKIMNLNPNVTQIIPMLVTLNAKEMSDTQKTSVDLVCVIDKSGSMSGRKLELLKETFKSLMDLLNEQDRLSVVTFDSFSKRITPLLAMNKKGKSKTLDKISQISADGGTDICRGMMTALEILKQRRIVNNVTGIFLLSDGLDSSADSGVKKLVRSYDEFPNSNNISINTFGFGDDHDPKLMGNISKLKDGNFYYIDKLDIVDECFGDCLIGLMSILAEQITFSINVVSSDMFPNIKIQKAYGSEGSWKNENEVYKTTQRHLISGKKRNHILDISIPPCKDKLDGETKVVIAKAEITMFGLKESGFQKFDLEKELTVTFVNEEDKISDDYIDFDVMFNYYRVKSAQVINKASKLADLGENKQAEKELIDFREEISKSKFAENEIFTGMIKDINNTIENVQPQVYASTGMKYMVQNAQCLDMEQGGISANVGVGIGRGFSNAKQINFNKDMKLKKSLI